MRTSTLKSSPRSPPNLGGSAAGAGGLVLALCTPHNKKAPRNGGQREARGACSRVLHDLHVLHDLRQEAERERHET